MTIEDESLNGNVDYDNPLKNCFRLVILGILKFSFFTSISERSEKIPNPEKPEKSSHNKIIF